MQIHSLITLQFSPTKLTLFVALCKLFCWSTSSILSSLLVNNVTFGQHRHSWSHCLVNTFSLPVHTSNRVFQTDPITFNHKMNFSITLFNTSNNHKLNLYVPVTLIIIYCIIFLFPIKLLTSIVTTTTLITLQFCVIVTTSIIITLSTLYLIPADL